MVCTATLCCRGDSHWSRSTSRSPVHTLGPFSVQGSHVLPAFMYVPLGTPDSHTCRIGDMLVRGLKALRNKAVSKVVNWSMTKEDKSTPQAFSQYRTHEYNTHQWGLAAYIRAKSTQLLQWSCVTQGRRPNSTRSEQRTSADFWAGLGFCFCSGHKEEEAKPLPLINRHSVFWIMASMAVTYYVDFLNILMHDEHIKRWWRPFGIQFLFSSVQNIIHAQQKKMHFCVFRTFLFLLSFFLSLFFPVGGLVWAWYSLRSAFPWLHSALCTWSGIKALRTMTRNTLPSLPLQQQSSLRPLSGKITTCTLWICESVIS